MFILFFYRTLFILKKIIQFYKTRGFPVILQFLGRNMKNRYTILNEVNEKGVMKAIDEVYER